jgi:hypothetical protein
MKIPHYYELASATSICTKKSLKSAIKMSFGRTILTGWWRSVGDNEMFGANSEKSTHRLK